ncbi:MAG: hypothetical protein ACREXS_05925 [Gammaproteobacteria bacterium]
MDPRLPRGLEASGVGWAINVTTCMKAALKGWAARPGRWTEIDP